MQFGHLLARLMQKQKLSEQLLRLFIHFPFLLTAIVKKTHGKPIEA
jgi:hypothetical protein